MSVELTPKFGHWLAGFVDGEGYFMIRRGSINTARGQRETKNFLCEFGIQVRLDDMEIIAEIHRRTGLGRIGIEPARASRKSPVARWIVSNKADCRALIDIFDHFPLRAKKRRDFAIWRQAVLIHAGMRGRNNDWSSIAALSDELGALRRFSPIAGEQEGSPAPQLKLFIA